MADAPGSRTRAPFGLMAAVFLLAASGLAFELTLTRIFSATIWYHYTFVAISVALFGWGLGGFLVYLLRLGQLGEKARGVLLVLTLLPAVLIPAFLAGILQFPFTPERLNLYFLLSLLPFTAGGAAMSLAFEIHAADANRLYFADLVGAACGVLIVPAAIGTLGAETTILAIAVLPCAAAMLLLAVQPNRRFKTGAVFATGLVTMLVVALATWNFKTQRLAIRDAPGKGLYQLLHAQPQARIDTDHWNAYSRITSVLHPDEFHLARLFIDSDAWTNILPWDGRPESMAQGRDWFRAFPFRLKEQPRVMVIGPGGGADVVLALGAGSPQVTAVELNPLIIDCVRRFGERAGNLYDHEKVRLVMSEGRNFIERTHEQFDFIVLGFVDSWASVSSGGLSLTEGYLYTADALEAYYDHISDDGALVIIRWPEDVRRLVANAYDVLGRRGLSAAEIGKHVLAVSYKQPPVLGANATAAQRAEAESIETVFMLSKSPLTPERVQQLLAGHDTAHIYWSPDGRGVEPFTKLFDGTMSLDEYAQAFPTLATPVRDDQPFYFATEKPFGLPAFVLRLFRIPLAAVVGFALLALIGAKVLGFRPPGPRTVAYFGALGVGFIVCEIALIQRLIMLLGHPLYTLVVILFTILLSSSIGSLLARRIEPGDIHKRLGLIIAAVVVLIVAGAMLLPTVVQAALPLGLGVRLALAALFTVPFGLLMGMPFPLGLRRMSGGPQGTPVSVLWGINGVASVVGSIGAMALAVVAGFTWVFLAAGLCYVVAWLSRPR